MVTDERHQAIDTLLREWDAGHEEEARAALMRVAKLLWGPNEPTVSMAKAKDALGLSAMSTLRVLLRAENAQVQIESGHTRIPFREIVRLSDSSLLRDLQATDRAHDLMQNLGSDEGMSEEQLVALEAGRPGQLPWKQEK